METQNWLGGADGISGWIVIRILVLLLATCLGGWLLFRWLEPRMVFVPYRTWDEDLLSTSRPASEIFFDSQGNTLSGIWFPAEPPNGTLVYCHGNAGNLSHRRHVVDVYRDQLGYSVLLFDYRGYGRSLGTPSEEGILADTLAAYGEALRLGGEVPALAGRSLGTVPATLVAGAHPVRALILDSPLSSAADMARRIFPIPGIGSIVSYRLDNLSNVRQIRCPLFVMHGDRDEVVPFDQGRRVFEAAPEPKRFLVLTGQDHNQPRTQPEVVENLRSFLESSTRQSTN